MPSCFSLTITDSTFMNFNQSLSQSTPVFVNSELSLSYNGKIVNLNKFAGPVVILGNKFFNNLINYESCDAFKDFEYAPKSVDNYPLYGTKDTFQIKNLISIRGHQFNISIARNNFTGNSVVKGLIYIKTL